MLGTFAPGRDSCDAHRVFRLPPNRNDEMELLTLEVLEVRVKDFGTSISAEIWYELLDPSPAPTSLTRLSELLRVQFCNGGSSSSVSFLTRTTCSSSSSSGWSNGLDQFLGDE